MNKHLSVGPLLLVGSVSTDAPAADNTAPVDIGKTFRQTEHVRANVTDDGLVILDIDKGEIYSANFLAARVWTMLMDGKTVLEVIDLTAAEFSEVSPEVLAADVKKLVASLVGKRLVE